MRLIEGALEKPGPAAAWMRLDVPMVEGEANTPLLQAVQAADFSSGVGQIVDMRQWTFINPEISLYFFRPPEGEWILIRSRTRAGANGAGLTMASLSDHKGPFAEVMQAMTSSGAPRRLRRPEPPNAHKQSRRPCRTVADACRKSSRPGYRPDFGNHIRTLDHH